MYIYEYINIHVALLMDVTCFNTQIILNRGVRLWCIFMLCFKHIDSSV